MTTLANPTTLTRESRTAREPLAMNGSPSRANSAFAAYELTGDSRLEAGVGSEEAYHRFLDRSVTIRRLLPNGIGRAQRYYTFVQSIHAQAMLHHPSIAQVLDAGIHDELPYAVLERPRGTTLEEHLGWLAAQGAQIDAHEALHTIDALADLLQYAHNHGTRVNNLVPSNIVLTDEGTPVLAQLGSQETPEALRDAEERLIFSAPELLNGALSDHRSDIYALGALLCYTLTGRALLDGNGYETRSEPALAGLPHDIDVEQLERVIRRATARRMAERYASVAAFRHDLANALVGRAEAVEWNDDSAQPEEPLAAREVGGAVAWPQPIRRQPAVLPALTMPASHGRTVAAEHGLPVQNPRDVPGAGREEFHGALPYTILVPLASEQQPEAIGTAGVSSAALSSNAGKLTLLSFLLVVVIALGAALMLG